MEKTVLSDGFRPQRWRYRWDAQGQIAELITPQGERWTYCYDAFGRRISKRRANVTRGIAGYDYQWSGDLLVAETPVYADGTAATGESVYWLYEPGALTPGARYENGQMHYVVRDHMGTPRELLTETGEVVRAQKLSVWGKAEQYRFGGLSAANDDDTAPHCPWRFAGQYADEESRLHYNRFRYYDAETGQYVSPDPIGLKGGLNPYGYVKNPLKWIDPFGLCKDDIITYRGDNRRSPDEIFRDGFKPKGDSNDLFLHALDSDNPPSNFISTTPDKNIATEFATSYGSKDGYVYYTRANNGIDINKTLGADSPFTREAEIAVPGGIKPGDVLGATPVNADGTWGNYTILNPNRY